MKNKSDYIDFQDWHAQKMKNPKFRKIFEEMAPQYMLLHQILRARIAKKMSQKDLADLVGTKQSAISRLESPSANPSLRLVRKVARALDTEITVVF